MAAHVTFLPVLVSLLFVCLVLLNSFACGGSLIKLTEDDWTQMLEGEWMVEFHAPWCPACKSLETTWQEFSTWSKDLDINVAQVDVTENPGLSGRFVVTALPTIFHVKDGVFRHYTGSRDKNELMSFIEDKKWSKIDSLPAWKRPDSLHMGALGWFFRLSMFLRATHQTMMDDYGLPYWGSYLVFAIVTIIVGSLLGLLIVCCIDCVFPVSKATAASDAAHKKDDDVRDRGAPVSESSEEADDEEEDKEKSGDDDAGDGLSRTDRSSPRQRKSKAKRDD